MIDSAAHVDCPALDFSFCQPSHLVEQDKWLLLDSNRIVQDWLAAAQSLNIISDSSKICKAPVLLSFAFSGFGTLQSCGWTKLRPSVIRARSR